MLWWILPVAIVLLGWVLRPQAFKAITTYEPYASYEDLKGKVDFRRINVKHHLPPRTGKQYAVIGTGFLGTYIIDQLLERGEQHIKAIDVVPSKKFANDPRVQVIQSTVLDVENMKRHLKGVTVVYCTFAVIKYWHRMSFLYNSSHEINVLGTENVISACIACDVQYLIQTSTGYVSIGWDNCRRGMTEEDGYTKQPFNHYSSTKILAEKAVLAANNLRTKGGKTLYTAVIRPCSAIFGYGDTLYSEKMACKPVFSPNDQFLLDYVYVENCAMAHLLLEDKLRTSVDQVAGEAFCISNGKPMVRAEWLSLWKAFHPTMKITMLSKHILVVLAVFSEFMQYLGKEKLLGELELLTPASLAMSIRSNSFDISKAQRILGYKPMFSNEEAIQKTVATYLSR